MQKPHCENILKSLIFGCPKNVIKRNQEHDRIEKDWEDNKGRAVV